MVLTNLGDGRIGNKCPEGPLPECQTYVKCLVGIITYSNVFCLRWLVGCFPQSGEMDIENHTTKDVCHLKYDAYNYFGRDTPRKVDKSSMYYLFECPFEA